MLHLDIMFSNEYFQFPLKWAENHSHYLLLWSDVLSPVSRPIKASLHAGRYFYSDSQVALRCMLADLALVQKSTVRAMRLTWMILIFIWTIHNSLGLIISLVCGNTGKWVVEYLKHRERKQLACYFYYYYYYHYHYYPIATERKLNVHKTFRRRLKFDYVAYKNICISSNEI